MSAEARAAPSGVSDAPGDVPAEAAQEAGGETVEINDEAEDAEVKDETVDAEVEPIVVAPSPTMPSAAEVEEHRISHIPYRCWCRPCVMGRGLGEQRGRHKGRAHTIAIIGIDYWYMMGEGFLKRKELKFKETPEGEAELYKARQEGRVVKCIVVRDHRSKNVFGHVIPCKGPDEEGYVKGLIAEDITWLGHVKLDLKSEQEVSLVALVKQAMAALRVSVEDIKLISDEHSQTYDSQASGCSDL